MGGKQRGNIFSSERNLLELYYVVSLGINEQRFKAPLFSMNRKKKKTAREMKLFEAIV